MASIFGIGSGQNNYSDLFGSLSTNSSSGAGSLFTDWASLKNGSYGKLTKAYYGKQDVKSVSNDEAKELIKQNTVLKSGATDMQSALKKLSSVGLYEKVNKKDDKGNENSDYDYDKIVGALKSFAEGYNSIIDKADESDNRGILRNAASMANITAVNQNVLSKIGITVGEDNKLKVDEAKVKEANINDIKSLFMESGSYGSQIDSRGTSLVNYVNAENNKINTYTANGVYNGTSAVGNIYDGTY